MKNTEIANSYWTSSGMWGLLYKDGSKIYFGNASEEDDPEGKAKNGALSLEKKYKTTSIEIKKRNIPKKPSHQDSKDTTGHLDAIKFNENYVAIPTIGGIITDLPLSAKDSARFPSIVQLRVSEKLAHEYEGNRKCAWLVVSINGIGSAITLAEAKERGLEEAPNWIPDLTGVSTAPEIGEIERILASRENENQNDQIFNEDSGIEP